MLKKSFNLNLEEIIGLDIVYDMTDRKGERGEKKEEEEEEGERKKELF